MALALEGSVKDIAIADVLQLIATQKKSGLLTFSKGQETLSISFFTGNVVHAFSGNEDEQLSNALILAEKITIVQLRAAIRTTPKGTPIGETFINLAYVTSEDIKKWNQTLTQEAVFSALSWESGSYQFEPQEVYLREDIYLPTTIECLLMEENHQRNEWPVLLSKIPNREVIFERVDTPQEEEVLSLSETNGDSLAQFLDTEEHTWLTQWIDGTRTVEGVIRHAGMGAFPIYKCLIELLAIGRIREKQDGVKDRGRFFLLNVLEQVLTHPILTNGILIPFVLIALATFFIPSFYGTESIPEKTTNSIKPFHLFTKNNQRDILEFSLNLYYLRHHRYPATLDQLMEEGLITTDREKKFDFNDFQYRSDGKTFDIVLLSGVSKVNEFDIE
jgi:hypothetical protein